ncbi:MAG: enterochelin esterase [Xanthomonadales bacterium]|nr:enterochelin esterase [Gammaproteobacteria bacterium]MBT8054733.1 enterochelin esterase [Gammaproteobacteria bacterium]NNK52911.1 enterochelin esterase [Xanthomonadales bacterium]
MPDVRPQPEWPKGTVQRVQHRSEVLADNPWGDPAEREVCVYLPHGYSDSGDPSLVLWDLAAYTNSGPGHLNWRNHGENLPSRLDRLIGQGKMDPVLVVFPDCYTSLGGNQYVNSPAVGRYADYLNQELVPLIGKRFNTVAGRAGRAAFGKSSGGYGALFLAMHYPEIWGAVASHAGDMGFDLVYRRDFPVVCEALSPFDGDINGFIQSFWRKNRPSGRDYTAMMILAMAASYDPDPEKPAEIRLPFDLRTCELDAGRWKRWLAYDPLNMLKKQLPALQSLHGLFIDVGVSDQYHIQYGARRFADKLREHGVSCHFEEFEGSHSAIDWRLDHSLPYLTKALKKAVSEPIHA